MQLNNIFSNQNYKNNQLSNMRNQNENPIYSHQPVSHKKGNDFKSTQSMTHHKGLDFGEHNYSKTPKANIDNILNHDHSFLPQKTYDMHLQMNHIGTHKSATPGHRRAKSTMSKEVCNEILTPSRINKAGRNFQTNNHLPEIDYSIPDPYLNNREKQDIHHMGPIYNIAHNNQLEKGLFFEKRNRYENY